jgi:hypothetical protein
VAGQVQQERARLRGQTGDKVVLAALPLLQVQVFHTLVGVEEALLLAGGLQAQAGLAVVEMVRLTLSVVWGYRTLVAVVAERETHLLEELAAQE